MFYAQVKASRCAFLHWLMHFLYICWCIFSMLVDAFGCVLSTFYDFLRNQVVAYCLL